MSRTDFNTLLEAGAHFGHLKRKWNPKMAPYIFMEKNGIHIIDLHKTVIKIDEAAAAIKQIAKSGRRVLFVATKREKLQIERQRAKLEKNLGSIADLTRLPAALFVVDVMKESNAVKEAKRLNIPVFAIVDTCCDPTDIDYVIPANDDASNSIAVILTAICAAVAEGTEERRLEKEKEAQEGIVSEEEGAPKKEGKPRIKKAVKATIDAEEAAVAEVVAATEQAATAAAEVLEAAAEKVEAAAEAQAE